MPRPRRLRILDASQCPIQVEEIDLTGLVNANSQYPLIAQVDQQCDLGHWHKMSALDLIPWGAD